MSIDSACGRVDAGASMAAEVGAWEPAAALGERHARLLDAVAAQPGEAIDADAETATGLRQVALADAAQRSALFEPRESVRLVAWLKVLVLAEETIPGCDAGARSPAIAIARLLRTRGDYPPALTAWIKSASSNRFLPYGSLLDRL